MIYILLLRPPIPFKNQLFVVMGRPIHANIYPKSTAKHICIIVIVVAEYNNINLTIKYNS